MILCRIDQVVGSCEIANYDTRKKGEGGWFPLQSVGFGFEGESSSSQATTPTAAGQQRPGQQGGRQGGRQPQQNQAAKTDDKTAKLNLTKSVDVATVPLMRLAMDSRSHSGKKPAEGAATLKADIHFLGSVMASKYEDIHTFTFLRIHLEAVRVLNWSISGSGDERASETVVIGYEKVHMCYQPTPDAKRREAKLMAGWDQKLDKEWGNVVSTYYPDYPDKFSKP